MHTGNRTWNWLQHLIQSVISPNHISESFVVKLAVHHDFVSQESNGPSDAYAAISNADRLQAEPESLRKWREEQSERLEVLGKHSQATGQTPLFCDMFLVIIFLLTSPSSDANSRKQEAEWKEKAKVELEEWHARQNEQLEKTKTSNRYWLPRGIYTRIRGDDGGLKLQWKRAYEKFVSRQKSPRPTNMDNKFKLFKKKLTVLS